MLNSLAAVKESTAAMRKLLRPSYLRKWLESRGLGEGSLLCCVRYRCGGKHAWCHATGPLHCAAPIIVSERELQLRHVRRNRDVRLCSQPM